MSRKPGPDTSELQGRVPTAEARSSALVALARTYLQSGAYREAQACVERAISGEDGASPEALILLATSLLRQGRIPEAGGVRAKLDSRDLPLSIEAELRVLDSRLLVASGRWRECIDRFGAPLERPAAGIADLQVALLVAQSHARLEDTSAARRILRFVLRESFRLVWPEGAARSRTAMALLDRTDGNWREAEDALIRAKVSFAQLGLFRDYVVTLVNLGLQRLWQGSLSAAEETLREAVRLAGEMGEPEIEVPALADHALALVRLQRLPEARKELARALRLCRRQGSPRWTAVTLEYTGEYHLAENRISRAELTLSRALRVARRAAPDGDIVPEVLRRLAEAALRSGDHDQALRLADDAEERAVHVGDRYERAAILRVRGETLLGAGRPAEAEPHLQCARAILEKLGEKFEHERVLRLIRTAAGSDAPKGRLERPEESASARRPSAPALGDAPAARFREFLRLAASQGIIGGSSALREVLERAALVAPTSLPVLIQGETGTGKELLARTIHAAGRARGQFIGFNCATCPGDLLDAELFGHTRGAFTGAASERRGLVRSAQEGSLFLDEIGELGQESQARLLRMFDSGEIRPLGSDSAVQVQVRIIAATHADLKQRVEQGRFRSDLFFRLAGVLLSLPPLRDRKGDLRRLVEQFTAEARESINPAFGGIAEPALAAMERYPWPGNIRELRHQVLRLAALSAEGAPVTRWDPPEAEARVRFRLSPEQVKEIMNDAGLLRRLVQDLNGRMNVVALHLGISRTSLYRLFHRHGIDVRSLRAPGDGR